MEPKPLQHPHVPIWLGGGHSNVLRRAVTMADGWMGAGASSNLSFKARVAHIRPMLEEAGRDPAHFTISKRIYISVDNNETRALDRLRVCFNGIYGNANLADEVAVWGSPEKCIEILNDVASVGVDHLLLHPLVDFEEQLEAVSELSRA